MKISQSFINKKTAMSVAKFMEAICLLVMLLMAAGAVLSVLGRQEFILHTPEKTYEQAIIAEKDHEFTFRALTASMKDKVYVTAHDGVVDIPARIGLTAMYLATVLPVILSFHYLSRVFRNVGGGSIFIEENAKYLLYYGLLQMFGAMVCPFIKLFICYVTDLLSRCAVHIATGQDAPGGFIPNLAFIVAAYIIHYGIQLQDEADHTL